MRTIWVKADPWNKSLVTTALEGGAEAVMVPKGFSGKVKELGRIQTVSEDGDLKIGEQVVFFQIQSAEDEPEILQLSRQKQVVVTFADWSVIPLENLIARGARIIAHVRDFDEAQTAFGILEKGVNHILVDTQDPGQLAKILTLLNRGSESIALSEAEIKHIRPVGMGDRVCVDTCTTMAQGEGMLVGNSSNALFLVHAESIENPYVAPRPFRVNAGPVHAYTRTPDGKTRYLSELRAGDSVQIVNYKGEATEAVIGRLKIEKRPLVLIAAVCNGKEISVLLQNAETIRLTAPDGLPLSVASLSTGDKVLVAMEEGARHFGYAIEETISEK